MRVHQKLEVCSLLLLQHKHHAADGDLKHKVSHQDMLEEEEEKILTFLRLIESWFRVCRKNLTTLEENGTSG